MSLVAHYANFFVTKRYNNGQYLLVCLVALVLNFRIKRVKKYTPIDNILCSRNPNLGRKFWDQQDGLFNFTTALSSANGHIASVGVGSRLFNSIPLSLFFFFLCFFNTRSISFLLCGYLLHFILPLASFVLSGYSLFSFDIYTRSV